MWASPATLRWPQLRDSWLWGPMGLSKDLSQDPTSDSGTGTCGQAWAQACSQNSPGDLNAARVENRYCRTKTVNQLGVGGGGNHNRL